MKILSILHILILSILLVSCGSDSDSVDNNVVGDIAELVGYDGPTNITDANAANFPLSGKCVGDESVVLSGSIDFTIQCSEGTWQQQVDFTSFPNGAFSITITTASGQSTFSLTKNDLAALADAVYKFENAADLGADSKGNHNAVSVNSVVGVNDADQGNSAQFNGADSSIVLSDGSFLNDAFTQRSVLMRFKASDLSASQILLDEGGATNAFGIKIESNALILATRVGGSSGMESVSVDISGRENQWITVLASFDNGVLFLETPFGEASKTAAYTEIPRHTDTAALGKKEGSDAFDSAGDAPFAGLIDEVMILAKDLSDTERDLYFGREVTPIVLSSETIGRVGFLSFANAANMAVNSADDAPATGSAIAVTQGSDADLGSTAIFSGSSSIQLSDSTYFNSSFETKTFAFYFKATDVFNKQSLIDEGGATNGISLYFDNGYLVASARNGGTASQVDLIADLSDKSGEWVKVVLSFNKGAFSLCLNNKDIFIQRNTGFTSIPDHGDNGGIGRLFGSDSSDARDTNDAQFFSGEMAKFSIYSRVLTDKEIEKY